MAVPKEGSKAQPEDEEEATESLLGNSLSLATSNAMEDLPQNNPRLPTSCSVPLFKREEDEVWTSDTELDTTKNGTNGAPMGLRLSQSYRSPHKVQFAEPVNPSTNLKSPSGKKKRWRTASETSTVSCTSVSSATSSTTTSLPGAPDGGFGWVVVAASFFVNMIADGVTFSFGVMFDEFQNEFDCSKAKVAGVVSVFHALPLLSGPAATWLCDRYGCRNVTVVGSVMASAGFLAAAFSNNIYLLYLFFGVLAGCGLSLCYVASIIIVAYYFDRRRSFATGISVCGSGVGTFVFAPFTQYLMDTYDGWRGACIILAGVFLNMAVCGMLFRDLPALATRRRLGRGSSSRSLGPNTSTTTSSMPDVEQLRAALQEGDVSHLINEEAEEPMLASSLVTLPTYIKRSSQLPAEVAAMLGHNQETYRYIQENFPDSLTVARSVSDYRLQDDLNVEAKEGKVETTGVKLKRRVSSMMRTKSILKKKEVLAAAEDCCFDDITVSKAPGGSSDQNRSQRLHNLRVRRQSLTYRGACLSTARYRMRASSCPDIYRNSMGDLAEEESGMITECLRSLTQCASLTYMSAAFALFCLSNFILYFWYDVPYVYTIGYVEKNLDISNAKSTMVLSVIGVLNTIGEVVVGWVADQPSVSSHVLYAVCMVVCGLVTAVIPCVKSYPLILILSATYGLCISANYSLTSPILVELISLDQFSAGYGFLLFCQGVGNLLGPPVAGGLYDATGDWMLTFLLAGLFIAFSGAMLLFLNLAVGKRQERETSAQV